MSYATTTLDQSKISALEAVTLGAPGGHDDDPQLMGLLSDKIGPSTHVCRERLHARFVYRAVVYAANAGTTQGIVLADSHRLWRAVGSGNGGTRHAVL